jgi:HD-like signal output (HDOD) protein
MKPTPFPLESLSAVTAALDNPGHSMAQVANLIEQEPAFVGLVLRSSNTMAYAGRERVRSVQAAVVRLGKANVKRVLLDAAMGALVARAA